MCRVKAVRKNVTAKCVSEVVVILGPLILSCFRNYLAYIVDAD